MVLNLLCSAVCLQLVLKISAQMKMWRRKKLQIALKELAKDTEGHFFLAALRDIISTFVSYRATNTPPFVTHCLQGVSYFSKEVPLLSPACHCEDVSTTIVSVPCNTCRAEGLLCVSGCLVPGSRLQWLIAFTTCQCGADPGICLRADDRAAGGTHAQADGEDVPA